MPESRILEENSENLEKWRTRRAHSEDPAPKKSKLERSKILSGIKRRVDNSGMGMENEDVGGSDKETDLRQVINAR